jgi:tripartite-type tricarboxylate transporter receptor subunit TctC
LHQVIDGKGVKYDASKFYWFGSTGTYNSVAYAWHTAGVRTVQDLMEREVLLGGTGVGSSIVIYPMAMNKLLGTRFKIVLGYRSTLEIDVAMERGEVQARTGSYTALASEHPDWLHDKKINLLVQIGSKREKALPDIPLLTEIAKAGEQREILKLISSPIALGRPFLAPPGVPPERLALLQRAFDATLRDQQFLAEATKLDHQIDPVGSEEITQIVNETIQAKSSVIDAAKKALEHAP